MISQTIACDTETGGLYPAVNPLLSIAAVSSSNPDDPFLVYVDPASQPGTWIEPEAARVNGYTPELWEQRGEVPLHEAMGQFRNWLSREKKKGGQIVCHNLAFDRGFLMEAERITGIDLPGRYDWRCSMQEMATQVDRGLILSGSCSLDRLGDLSGFWKKEARAAKHDALQDARACLHGWKWLKRNAPKADERWVPAGHAEAERGELELCECATWASAELAGHSGQHHPRCGHYRPDPPDPRHAKFGRLMWEWIEKQGSDFCGREESEEILPMAEKAGLCRRVVYDPAVHGADVWTEPGSEIWYWGKEGGQQP